LNYLARSKSSPLNTTATLPDGIKLGFTALDAFRQIRRIETACLVMPEFERVAPENQPDAVLSDRKAAAKPRMVIPIMVVN
jgi:hypothetical protein